MKRKGFIATSTAALAFPKAAAALPGPAGDDPMRLVPVRVSADRVIRTTTCLRPFRPEGFVLRADTLGNKPIVHNYGHGGGGVSLSWGVASLAADLAGDRSERTAAVIGAGAVGLATARVLQDRGFRVAIYAAHPPLETTSSRSGAQWSPVSTSDPGRGTAEYTRNWVKASTIAYRTFQDMIGDLYGVRWIENYAMTDDPTTGFPLGMERAGLEHLYPDVKTFGPGEHPFPSKYAIRSATMLIDPPTYLAAVLRDFLLRGGTLTIRSFANPNELATLEEAALFNCTGLGAKALFGDDGLMPVKGQLSVLLPQAEVEYITLGPQDLYMFPRPDGIVLGGTHDRNVWLLDVDDAAQTRILAAHSQFFDAMRAPGKGSGSASR